MSVHPKSRKHADNLYKVVTVVNEFSFSSLWHQVETFDMFVQAILFSHSTECMFADTLEWCPVAPRVRNHGCGGRLQSYVSDVLCSKLHMSH